MVILAAVVGLFPWACTHAPKPFAYETNRELKPGPGLFSGEDGVFTIYGASEDPEPQASVEKGAAKGDPAPEVREGKDRPHE
ncbi:hypothetical protein [Desulfococcus sp.]|uniref:hypothetical protein n=1 Tax=Desulfococcus sp. TaxID=2025834 RepID=UPI0035933217